MPDISASCPVVKTKKELYDSAKAVSEDRVVIAVPKSECVIFSLKKTKGLSLDECMKQLTHFKRIFRYYYKMSVSDYIRKRRLQAAAEQIRSGIKCADVAKMFNFKTYTGFARAFQKEFNMTPAVSIIKYIFTFQLNKSLI